MSRFPLSGWLRGRRLVLPAAVLIQLVMLVRNLAVARLLGPEQFGIAVALLLAIQFLDASADAGLNRFLISNPTGGRVAVQQTVHFASLLRGGAAAILILLLATPVLQLLGVEVSTTAIVLLASAPLFNALSHFDVVRYQRSGHLGHQFFCMLAAECAGLIVAVGVAYASGSYVAVIAGWAARGAAQVIASHIFARRPYSARYHPQIARELFRYSAPLSVNGPLLFASAQADRALLVFLLGPTHLGLYAAALMLVSSPSAVMLKVIGATFLPKLASAQRSPSEYRNEEGLLRSATTALAMTMMAGFAVVGPLAIPIVYGAKFQSDAAVVGAIGILQALRLARVWPSTVALATSRTKNVLLGNIVRFAGIPAAVALLWLGYGLEGLVLGFCVGEFLSLGLCAFLLRDKMSTRGSTLALFGMGLIGIVIALGLGATEHPISGLLIFLSYVPALVLNGVPLTTRIWKREGRLNA